MMAQLIQIIGAFLVLSTLTLSVNSTMLSSVMVSLECEAMLNATSIGQSLIDEILSKNYDEKTVNKKVYNTSELSSVAALGPDAGEAIVVPDTKELSLIRFDDVDDYHNYVRVVNDSTHLGTYTARVSIAYVQESNCETASNTPTYFKRITVQIENAYMRQTSDGSSTIPVTMTDLSIYRRYF
jgi:hypothetical protein